MKTLFQSMNCNVLHLNINSHVNNVDERAFFVFLQGQLFFIVSLKLSSFSVIEKSGSFGY